MTTRRAFLAASAALVLPTTSTTHAQTPESIDPYVGAINTAQRTIVLVLPAPPQLFDIVSSDVDTDYRPRLQMGVAAYENPEAANRGYQAFLLQMDTFEGLSEDSEAAEGESAPAQDETVLLPAERYDPGWSVEADDLAVFRHRQVNREWDRTIVFALRGDTVHAWIMSPGPGDDQGPTEEPIRQLIEYWFPGLPNRGPYAREQLLALLPVEEDILQAIEGIIRVGQMEEIYGEG